MPKRIPTPIAKHLAACAWQHGNLCHPQCACLCHYGNAPAAARQQAARRHQAATAARKEGR